MKYILPMRPRKRGAFVGAGPCHEQLTVETPHGGQCAVRLRIRGVGGRKSARRSALDLSPAA